MAYEENPEKKQLHPVALFLINIFYIVLTIFSSPMIYNFIQNAKEGAICSADYVFMCFVYDAILPGIFVILLFRTIKSFSTMKAPKY